jgi:A/G-specific adenine glycosylase
MSKFLVSLQQFDQWFQRQKRVLPWRDQPSVYRVWISEIMLQQTQVITVIPYFEKFMTRFPTVEHLAEAVEEDVLYFWAGLGYYSRARNLHKAAKQIVAQGRFPKNREEWLEIPGVGNYTAGAILSIASDFPEAILDGNVERVLSRIRRVNRQKGDTEFKSRLWKLSKIFVETAHRHGIRPSVLNQALMELGATLCTPKKPKCLICPISSLCKAAAWGEQESYPPKKAPRKWLRVEEELHCWISEAGKVLLRKRQAHEWRAGLWDLVETQPQEVHQKQAFVGSVETKYVVTRHKVNRLTNIWKVAESPALSGLQWVSLNEPEVPVGAPLKKTLKEIRSRMEAGRELE